VTWLLALAYVDSPVEITARARSSCHGCLGKKELITYY
jgi:hypothetical protein